MITYNCPHCHKPPTVTVDPDGYIYRCEVHGHMAMGKSVEETIRHWNRYVQFIVTGDIEHSYRLYSNPVERAIFRGLYGISDKEI